jgi:predicted nucleotidyltransferase
MLAPVRFERMKEMTMLDLDRVDLGELCSALEDNMPEHDWWLDPDTGELEFRSAYFDEYDEDLDERELVHVEPIGSDEAYGDMEDFTERVRDPRARDLLERAIAGRGAFRRFKDTLFEFPQLRDAWFTFHDARMRRRAIEWLRDVDLISDEVAARALAAEREPDLPELGGALDPHAIARAIAADLRELYGNRLKDVVLFGSWARGDAHPESDIDLLVVLDEVPSRYAEMKRMDDVMWRHSLENDTVVTELPVSDHEYRESGKPLLVRVRAEGVSVA